MLDSPAPPPSPENNDLSESEVKKLTSQLSQEIDQEIKKQFAENQSFEKTQGKVDDLLKQASVEKEPEVPPRSFEKPKFTPSPELENFKAENGPSSLDPLRSSIETAMENLKEGDNVSKDWMLRKVLTTSFGNNKSSFFELENRSGAHWTLSPEEMKDVLRTEILTKKNQEDEKGKEKPSLEAKPDNVLPVRRDVETIIEPLEDSQNKEVNKADLEKEKTLFKPEEPVEPEKNLSLTKKQVELVNKLHSDKNLWDIFTTFSPEVWEKVYKMYENGKLTEIGIDAHPLLDQIENGNLGTSVEIQKGTTATALLSDSGYKLTWTTEDSVILGCHILANYDTLNEAIKKVESSGIAVSPLKPKKDIIGLMVAAKNNDPSALSSLQEGLRFLPVNGKFKVIKPEELEPLKKFIF